MKQLFKWALAALLLLPLAACSEKDGDGPLSEETKNFADNIVGDWVMSTSDADNWITLQFTESASVFADICQRGFEGTATGSYTILNNRLTGAYTDNRNDVTYLDWVATDIKPLEISMEVYDNNEAVGNIQLYRIVSEIEVEVGTDVKPTDNQWCEYGDMSDFESLNSDVAEVNYYTGKISGVSTGFTFITFDTPKGRAALKVTVTQHKTFEQQIVGTWVADMMAEKKWERYTFTSDGIVSAQWTAEALGTKIDEDEQGNYTVSGNTVSFSLDVQGTRMSITFDTESITDMSWSFRSSSDGASVGKYTLQRVLESYTVSPQEQVSPNYASLTGGVAVQGFKSHNTAIATVASDGRISAVAPGRTYIDVQTAMGDAVIEIEVESSEIPIAFQECLGKNHADVKKMIGGNPLSEDDEMIIYASLTSAINYVGINFDEWSGLADSVVVTYNNSVNTANVTRVLNETLIPFTNSQTSSTFLAFMDTADRKSASFGVTWNIAELTLIYFNLNTPLFKDYSVLLNMTESQVIRKMGMQPSLSDEEKLAFLLNDNKGVRFVVAYYTDFNGTFSDKVMSVGITFDDTLTEAQITEYLKKVYNYYPDYSEDDTLVFVPDSKDMEIAYMPENRILLYIPFNNNSSQRPGLKAVRMLEKKIVSFRK